MDAFGIFEGGGAKGIAHIGALKAAEEQKVRFLGVAGTSAGAIVAALVAAGYSADEMYSPDRPHGLFAVDFVRFLNDAQWKKFKGLREAAEQSFQGCDTAFSLWLAASKFLFKHKKALTELCGNLGFFQAEEFRRWMEQSLLEKLLSKNPSYCPTGPAGCVAFSDLLVPLKIIVADISNRRVRTYSSDKTPQESVSHAVAASISIPLAFMPQQVDGAVLVDGGIVSNFPAWVFDRERQDAPQLTPSFGFRLASNQHANKPEEGNATSKKVLDYLESLYVTAVFGDTSLETRQVESLYEIPLRVRIGPLDFTIDDQTKNDVYRDGKDSARDFFLNYIGPRNPGEVKSYLQTAAHEMRRVLEHATGHLRVNVMRPIGNDKLQVTYTYGMDDDCDDRLKFKIGEGACSECWHLREPIICDLEDALTTFSTRWKMDKYQQRFVRNTLKSLLSVPIFDPDTLGPEGQVIESTRIVGILNFDSDDRITAKFSSPAVLKIAAECSGLVFRLLKR